MASQISGIVSRLAPTPSGFLHLGNCFNFLLTAAIVQQQNGILRLRIDDMDAARVRADYIADIFDTLHWLGITWQEGPADSTEQTDRFSQQLRLPRYREILQQLVDTGNVFACQCSRKDIQEGSQDGQYPGTCRTMNIPLDTPGCAWRLVTPTTSIVTFEDVLLGTVSMDVAVHNRDFIIRRRDGLPAYQVTSLADDIDFGINTIVRGQDLLNSTAAQLFLAKTLNQPFLSQGTFYHHPLVLDREQHKLSKSAASQSVISMRQSGMPASEIIDYFKQWCAANGIAF